MNVFVKPDEQRLSLLRLCHGEKMKVKPTIKTFMGGLIAESHLQYVPHARLLGSRLLSGY